MFPVLLGITGSCSTIWNNGSFTLTQDTLCVMPIPPDLHRPATPGLFITGTDTNVGKTVVACLIADQWRRHGSTGAGLSTLGVLKPFATGCRRDREGLVSPDAEQLAHAAHFDPDIGDLDLITPIRFRAPLTPAAAVEHESPGASIDWPAIDRSLRRLDDRCDQIIVEGVGGILAPLEQLDRNHAPITVVDLARAIGYPIVVVSRAGLGTLNHTALTCQAVRNAGLSLAGVVINGYEPDAVDLSFQTNRQWIARQNRTRILATLPGRSTATGVESRLDSQPWDVRSIPSDLRAAIDATDFSSLARPSKRLS